jgi:hypothetical protein
MSGGSALAVCSAVGFFRRLPPPPPPSPPPPSTLLAALVVALLCGIVALVFGICCVESLSTGRAAAAKAAPCALTAASIRHRTQKIDAPGDEHVAHDPRHQLSTFFQAGDARGPCGLLENNSWTPCGDPTEYFSVWRPTSNDAIRMMMSGKATGKGLNVKGKSAKQGELSGYVPFLQISDEGHKAKVATSPPHAMIRVYWHSASARDEAAEELQSVILEMLTAARVSQTKLVEEEEGDAHLPEAEHRLHVSRLTKMVIETPTLTPLDECDGVWGLELPERLLWEVYVMRQDISHPAGWETGRPSEPDYMDMNLHSTRKGTSPAPPTRVPTRVSAVAGPPHASRAALLPAAAARAAARCTLHPTRPVAACCPECCPECLPACWAARRCCMLQLRAAERATAL